MSFVSKNEIEQFSFDDCQIAEFNIASDYIELKLDGLIVNERNTQNANFTKSYADTTKLRLNDGKILSVVIAGFSVYDADDNLIERIDDKEVAPMEWDSIPNKIKGAYLYRMLGEKNDDRYVYDLEIEQYTETGVPDLRDDTYIIKIEFSESIFSWDKYLNRVQN